MCVGCAGPDLATQMGKQMRLANCTNSFIESQANMPRWGQLGCSGFIILDGSHRVVEHKTSAFMQVRDLAFRHVEALVDALVDGKPTPEICPGQFARISGLQSKKELNGEVGICMAVGQGANGDRCAVSLLRTRQNVSVKPANLAVVNDLESGDDSAPEGGS